MPQRLLGAACKLWMLAYGSHARGRVRPFAFRRDPSAGVTPIRLPPSSPNLNAYAERFVRSIPERVPR